MRLPTADNPAVLIQGDALEVLRGLPDGCVDAVVTDPPYGIALENHATDSCMDGSNRKRVRSWEIASDGDQTAASRPTPTTWSVAFGLCDHIHEGIAGVGTGHDQADTPRREQPIL